MRDLDEIIDKMLNVIPSAEKDLIASLKSTQDSFRYSAPEIARIWWMQTLKILENDVGEPTEDWQKEVQRIFSGR